MARSLARRAAARGVEGASVLEIGGGIGQVALELLKAGAASAEVVELLPDYEPFVRELAAEAGVAERMSFRTADLVAEPAAAARVDLVVMNKVVCCTPDGVALAGIAASLARRTLVLSFPRGSGGRGPASATVNLYLRLRRRRFRVFVHPHGRARGRRRGTRLQPRLGAERAAVPDRGVRARLGFDDERARPLPARDRAASDRADPAAHLRGPLPGADRRVPGRGARVRARLRRRGRAARDRHARRGDRGARQVRRRAPEHRRRGPRPLPPRRADRAGAPSRPGSSRSSRTSPTAPTRPTPSTRSSSTSASSS